MSTNNTPREAAQKKLAALIAISEADGHAPPDSDIVLDTSWREEEDAPRLAWADLKALSAPAPASPGSADGLLEELRRLASDLDSAEQEITADDGKAVSWISIARGRASVVARTLRTASFPTAPASPAPGVGEAGLREVIRRQQEIIDRKQAVEAERDEARAEVSKLKMDGYRSIPWDATPAENMRLRDENAALSAENARLSEQVKVLGEERDRAQAVNERDRSLVATALLVVKQAMDGRRWLADPEGGRGSYAYSDEGFKHEFGQALGEIDTALEPLRLLARDWSDCPTSPAAIRAARALKELSDGQA